MGPAFSERWTPRAIRQACGPAHRKYKRGLEEHYSRFFASNPVLAGSHRWKARDRAGALPPEHAHLEKLIPTKGWHQHHLSAGSSQMLAVALFGSAIEQDHTLRWLADVLVLGAPFSAPAPKVQFEFALNPQTLNEHPFVSSIDLLVDDDAIVLCMEAKLWEEGLGACRCGKDGEPDGSEEQIGTPAQERAACSTRILERHSYWAAAREVLALPERVPGRPCPIAASYQAVRNLAAARVLARGRQAVFGLFYDDRNPYFRETGSWPGWPAVITQMVDPESNVSFRACSWQRLLTSRAVPDDVREWAHQKHGI